MEQASFVFDPNCLSEVNGIERRSLADDRKRKENRSRVDIPTMAKANFKLPFFGISRDVVRKEHV